MAIVWRMHHPHPVGLSLTLKPESRLRWNQSCAYQRLRDPPGQEGTELCSHPAVMRCGARTITCI